MSSPIRITGMASGLDVDSLVKQMMSAEKVKVDKLSQNRQVVQWKQDLYRDIMGDLNTFKSTYFDVLKQDSYMLSSNSYSSFEISSDQPKLASATAAANAVAGNYTLTNVSLATKATQSGNTMKVRQTENAVSFPINSSMASLSVDITEGTDTTTYNVNLTTGDYNNVSDLVNHINSQLSKSVKAGDTNTTNIASKLQAKLSDDGTQILFTNSVTGNTVKVNGTTLAGDTLVDSSLSFDVNIKQNVNDQLMVNIDGTNYKVALPSGAYKLSQPGADNDLIDKINYALSHASKLDSNGNVVLGSEDISINGSVQASFSSDGNRLNFTNLMPFPTDVEPNKGNINISGIAMKSLGFSSSYASINPTSSSKMSSLMQGTVSFSMNGQNFSYDFTNGDKDKTIQSLLDDIYNKAGVKASYSELSRKFSIASQNTGSDQQFNISWDSSVGASTSDFLDQIFNINAGNSTQDAVINTKYAFKKSGTDATVTIQDSSGNISNVIKSSNNFSIDGVNYSLLQSTTAATPSINFTVTANPQKSFDKIKAFVDKYNEIIDKINTKLFEKKQYSYKPLTDDQKKDMKDDEIKAWEDKAKEGLLANDSSLSNMLYSMRSAFYDPVKNNYADSGSVGISMADIGITSSSDVSQRGKLIIDETKLKEALQNKGDKVMQLFTKTSTSVPNYSANATSTIRDHRYKELGLFQRVNDILQDNLRTIRDNSGRKGVLLEKAGIKGDYSEFHNLLTDDLTSRDKIIKDMTSKLADKENKYYLQFSKLETAMQKLNSQSSWLSQQLSSSSG